MHNATLAGRRRLWQRTENPSRPHMGALLIAPLRPYDLALASDTLGGRVKRNDFGGRLRRRQERVEKQRGRQQPKVDRSAEHWAVPQLGSERTAGCPQLPPHAIREHTGVFTLLRNSRARAWSHYLTMRY